MIRRKPAVLQKSRLAALLRPVLGLLRTEFPRAHLAGEGPPVWTRRQSGIDLCRREPERCKIGADAGRPLASTGMEGDVALREAIVVKDPLRDERRQRGRDSIGLEPPLCEPAPELPAYEIAAREQCNRLGPCSLGIGALLRVDALASSSQAVFA